MAALVAYLLRLRDGGFILALLIVLVAISLPVRALFSRLLPPTPKTASPDYVGLDLSCRTKRGEGGSAASKVDKE